MTTQTSTSASSGDRLQDAAANVADRVTDTAQQQVGVRVDTGLSRAGDTLDQVAEAIRRTGDDLRQQQPQIASAADTAAGQLDRAARYLRETSGQELLGQAEQFARQQPAIFLGGAMMIGLVAARFLKAGPTDRTGSGSWSGQGARGRDDSGWSNRAGIASNAGGGWDRSASSSSSGLRAVGPGATAGSGAGSSNDDATAWSSDPGVLEHGRA
jgi:hypothetical protein